MATRYSLLKTLTAKQLREIAKQHDISGFSGLKKAELAKLLAEQLPLSVDEINDLVERFKADKLLGKVRDAREHFLTGRVEIEHFSSEMILAKVAGYTVSIENLGTPDFVYRCDEKCADWLYQVSKGRYPFCKHYAAVIAQLVYEGLVESSSSAINHFSEPLLSELSGLVETRKREEGAIAPPTGRGVEKTLACLQDDFLCISCQNSGVARAKYRSTPDRVFEILVEQAFQLLEFDTIPRTGQHGWDLLILGTLASPPYIAVAEIKTAAGGFYYINPEYLIRLKSYCLDMVKHRLAGKLCDYVQYMLLVAPDFPAGSDEICSCFQHEAEGMKLALFPAGSLLHLVERYRAEPILSHTLLAKLFGREKIISIEDVDALFTEAETTLDHLIEQARALLRQHIEHIAERTADACFIKFDLPSLGEILKDLVSTLAPELVFMGKKEYTGEDTVYIKHDYYALWGRVLSELTNEFAQILEQESLRQEKKTELKQEVCQFLELW
jgi:hypothetical protein